MSARGTQQIGQADISLLKKNELRDRLGAMRKAFDKYLKDKEAAANKAVSSLSFGYDMHGRD